MLYKIPSDCQVVGLNYIYEKYLPPSGIFVEVGAYDGYTHSNTCFLADAGWKGVYIEPVPEYLNKCKERHSANNCIFINSLVGDDQEKDFFIAGEWSTYSKEVANQISSFFGVIFSAPVRVKSKTLNFNIEEQNINNIDLLVIDCEGAELTVLNNFNISKYNPKVCILELHEKFTPMWHNENHIQILYKINTLMISQGYQKIYSDEINSVFVLK